MNIEFVSEDKAKNTRVYRVEHSGPGGKEEHLIALNLATDFIFINGSGGDGKLLLLLLSWVFLLLRSDLFTCLRREKATFGPFWLR